MAILLAAGTGSRLGQPEPKQFVDLNGRPVIARTVANLAWCARVVVVHHPGHRERTVRALAGSPAPLTFVPGGSTRRLSIAAALAALSELPDTAPVLLQNAASPNTAPDVARACVEALATHEMAQAFVPAVHTVFRRDRDELAEVFQRSTLGYTVDPTAVRAGCLRRIVEQQAAEGVDGEMTLDSARGMGIAIRLVPSPGTNIKLTTALDLVVLEHLTRDDVG